MQTYLDLARKVMAEGSDRTDRTGTGTRSLFGAQLRFDLRRGFPLVTTKKVGIKSIIYELLWFLRGDTNIRYLVQNGVSIWNEWPYEGFKASAEFTGETLAEFIERVRDDADFAARWGDLGPVYGKQWRRWEGKAGEPIDQIQDIIDQIKTNPDSRRLIVSGWNVADIMGLIKAKRSAPPPCHTLFQFYVQNGELSCQLYQRSADLFLGVPFNIASYSLLTMMIAQVCGLRPAEFIHTFGDVHIYRNHFEQINTQLQRQPKPLPRMALNPAVTDIFSFKFEDFTLEGYDPHPVIRGEVAV